jgi:hypothetical protein
VARNPYAAPHHPSQLAVTACADGTVRGYVPAQLSKPVAIQTYSIGCRQCHRQHDRRAERILDYWQVHAAPEPRPVVRAILGLDL